MHTSQLIAYLCFSEEKSQPAKKSDPVKISFDLSEDAAKKLTELAQAGDYALRQLGILSLQVEGGKVSVKYCFVIF